MENESGDVVWWREGGAKLGQEEEVMERRERD